MSDHTDLPELGIVSLFRFAWRQLTSMRTALMLLLLLAVASVPGSLVPQRTQNPMKVQEYFTNDPALAKLMDRFSLFDVYGSPWFSAIYILLFISLIGCVLPRTFEHLRAARALPPLTPQYLDRMEFFQSWDGTGTEIESAKKWLKGKRFRIREVDGSISAEKGYLRETGNLLFHLALILILIGVSLGALFGMRGEAIVNVGERFTNTPTTYDSLSYGKLFGDRSLSPFMLRMDNFVAKYNPVTNAPEDYTLKVTVTAKPGAPKVQRTIKVNSPLTLGNTNVYLQANGYSPIVTVRDKSGAIVLQGPIPFLPQDANLSSIGAIKVPDSTPQLGFVASFLPTAARDRIRGGFSSFPEALDPKLLLSAWKGDLGLDRGIPQSVYRIDTSKMEKIGLKSLNLGETFTFAGGSITFDAIVPWVNLQVVRDPGKLYALLGGILAILGLLGSLFTRRRRIWIRQRDGVVEVAGLAKNGAPGLENEIVALVDVLKKVGE
ncbi:MAG TPA: cytochrome c biogenesis protein ResB [Candidatus Paceibacterota bacterium]|nr:cytochrome c biogenesis protein ResB [Candidatus Paceibacterota bacterium]